MNNQMRITTSELPNGYSVMAEVDLMDEACERISRKIEIDGEKALELALAEFGYVKERICHQIDISQKYKPYVTHTTACSECGNILSVEEYDAPNFCPNCGAKVVD